MGMSFIGSYSGIDQNTIDQLMQAERVPLNKLTRQQTSIKGKMDAWKDVNTRLNSLFQKMDALKNPSTFNTKTAKSSDDSYVSMTAGTSAAEGKYTITVKELATNRSVVGKRITSTVPENKGGIFTIKNGDKDPVNIEVEAGESLKDIVLNINKKTKDTGITATIIDDRIVLNAEETGARKISLQGINGFNLEEIGLDVDYEIDGEGAGIKDGVKAQFILNDIVISSDSNTVKDVIEGVTINLNKKHDTGQSDTVTVSTDTEKAAKAMQDFVDQYNSTMQFIEEKTMAGDPEKSASKGVLAGESSLIRLQSSLRKLVTDNLNVSGSDIKDASQIGISTTDRSGKLTFDKDVFLKALGEDKDSVMNFLDPKVEGQVGFVDRANNYIDGFISKENGIIKSQNESFERSLKDLDTRIENFEARMVKKEAYYVRTFTALDLAMMKAESQMQWLQGQVDAMNGIKR